VLIKIVIAKNLKSKAPLLALGGFIIPNGQHHSPINQYKYMENTHGGKRAGAGRPTKRGKTKTYTVRLEIEDVVKATTKSGLKLNALFEKLVKEYR
jgi:hypothetical protein